MIRKILATTCVAAITMAPTFSCNMEGSQGIAAENNLWISVHNKSNGMTEELFNTILDRVEDIYTPVLTTMGKKLVVNRDWEDGTVNAYAQQRGKTWSINMFGGLARHVETIPDALAMVACHELGHHLGGAPKKKSFWSSSWASNEGQSDYWGAMKCFRKYAELDNNQDLMASVTIPATVTKKCSAAFANAEDIAICQRGSMAGQSLARLLGSLSGTASSSITFDTPDTKKVSKTNDNHPAAQCRLDSYFAGAICPVDHYSDVDDKDATINVCSRKASDLEGLRPLCWYKPVS